MHRPRERHPALLALLEYRELRYISIVTLMVLVSFASSLTLALSTAVGPGQLVSITVQDVETRGDKEKFELLSVRGEARP